MTTPSEQCCLEHLAGRLLTASQVVWTDSEGNRLVSVPAWCLQCPR